MSETRLLPIKDCDECKYTVAEAARSCGVTEDAWYRWKRGDRQPDYENCRALATYIASASKEANDGD